jgi:hypothetical protein
LIHADTEQEVIERLTEAGYWDNPAACRDLGDEPEDYSTVGNQQSRSEHALAEKLINAIDTKLIAAAVIQGVDLEGPQAPASMMAARDAFFGQEIKRPRGSFPQHHRRSDRPARAGEAINWHRRQR